MERCHLRRGDIGIIVAAAMLAVLCAVWFWWPKAAGKTVVLTTPDGERQLSLSKPQILTIKGRQDMVVIVEVADDRVRVRSSDCPDQICVHSGWLSQNGQAAACVPAGISVRVIGEYSEVDGVTA